MGTFISITIYDNDLTENDLSIVMTKAFEAIDHVESVTSGHHASSSLSKLNQNAGSRWVTVDSLLYYVIQSGVEIATITHGHFDPTVAPILDLWGFKQNQVIKPGINEIRDKLTLVNYKNILFNFPQIRFTIDGMALDLGGIAKGTAIDAASNQLKKMGVRDFLIDAGGDLAICSSDLTKGKIRVWIRHPRKQESLFGYFFLDDGFVATSGDYEQYIIKDGLRYHHIINPKTGFPDSDVISVSVIAKTAELADAYSTGIFVMGWDKGIDFVKKHPQLEVVILSEGKDKIKYWASESIMKKIKIIDDSL